MLEEILAILFGIFIAIGGFGAYLVLFGPDEAKTLPAGMDLPKSLEKYVE